MFSGCNRAGRLAGLSAVVLFIVTLGALTAAAQRQDGTLRGKVTDASGAVVPGATVTATHQDMGVTRSLTSEADGSFSFPNVAIGNYTITVELPGFQKFVRKDVEVRANQVTDVVATMAIGEVSTILEVSAGADLVQTTTNQLGGTVRDRAVTDIPNPSLGGSPLNLALIFPNTTSQPGGVVGEGGSVGGNRPRNNNFTIDGVDNNDVSLTGSLSPVIQDAVAEFNLLTNQFSAEFGHSTAGQFNILTKSGTNDLHGSAWYYGQNKKLNAFDNLQKAAIEDRRAAGLPDKPRYDFNRLGGMVGGPIKRDKIFFFGAYEYQTRGREATGVSVLTPTSAGLATLNTLAANQQVRDLLAQFPVAGASTQTVTVNGTSIPIGTYQAFAPDYFNRNDFQINIDANLASHQLRGRFLYDRYRAPNLNLDLPQSQFTGFNPVDNRKLAFTDVWTLSSRWVNDFRISYSRNVNNFTVPDQFANFPNVTISVLGLNVGPEGNSPQSGGQNVYQALDNIAYSRGRHSLKFGLEYRNWIAPSNFLPRARGEWSYLNLEQLVNDLVPTGLNGALRGAGSGFFAGNQQALYWFAQDDFKITPRFTLNLGLRYEWTGLARDVKLQELNSISTVPGLFEFRLPKSDKNNFSPRVGIAWDLFGDGKTAVRAGFGVAYDVSFQNLQLLELPPQLQTEQNPQLTCALANRPSWCGTNRGFLAGGGLLAVNVPPTTVAEARSATQGIIVDQTQPKTYTWSLSLQHELARVWQVELRYLGTRALELPIQMRANAISVFERNPGLALPTYFDTASVPASFPSNAPTRAGFLAAQALRYEDLGFDGGFLTMFPPVGNSIYHGGSIDVNRRLTRHVFLKGSYTYSRTIDDSTNELFTSRVNPRRPENPFNLRNERGLSALDRTHKFAMGWLYEVPNLDLGSRLMRGLARGWQISGSYIAETGQPITPISGIDANGDFDSAADRALVNPNGTALRGSTVNYVLRSASGTSSICDPRTATCPSAQVVGYVARDPGARFVVADSGTVTNSGRNIVRSPGMNNWNLSFFKNTYVTESKYVQFRVEMLNAFNHRQPTLGAGTVFIYNNNALSTSYANVASPNFLNNGQFSGGGRTIQYVLKIFF
jgi:hypothetical protein